MKEITNREREKFVRKPRAKSVTEDTVVSSFTIEVKDGKNRERNSDSHDKKRTHKIYGVDDKDKDETPEQAGNIVIKTLKEKLDIAIEKVGIDIAHIFGKLSKDGNRLIICQSIQNRQGKSNKH